MIRKVLLPLALFAAAGTAHAGDKPLYAPAPAWVRPNAPIDATKLTDSDKMILLADQQHRIEGADDWGYAEMAIRMISAQMLTGLGTLQLPWDPAKGDLIVHQLEIIRGAERIDLLKAGQKFSVLRREQQLEQASLNGMLTATLAVEGLRVGDVLRYAVSITRKDPALGGNVQVLAPLMVEPMPVQAGQVRLLWPKALDLKWKSYVGRVPAPVDLPNGWRELTIKLPLEKPVDLPSDAPMRFQPLPLFEASSYPDWASLSKGFEPLYRTEGLIAANSPIAAEVAKIAAATKDPRVRTAMALRVVQDDVRYLFKGMEDGNYVPQTPEQTWSMRYGDCKAKTLLLLAMLHALGIEAEPVLAHLGGGDLVAVRLPIPAAFNHVLVRAVVGGKSLWLDGTGGGSRLADLDDTPPLRWVLPLRAAGAQPLAVPMVADARPGALAEIDMDASAGILLPVTFKAKVTLRGSAAEMVRLAAAQGSKETSDQMIDARVAAYVANAQIVERKVSYDAESATSVITVSGIAQPEWAKESGRYKLTLDQIVGDVDFTPDRNRQTWRDLPVGAGANDSWRIVQRIRLPNGGKDFALEGDQPLPAMLAGNAVKRAAKLEGGVLTVDQSLATGLAEVAVADIPAVREQVTLAKSRPVRIAAPLDSPARWRQVAAARAAKGFDPALAIFAQRIAADPAKAQPLLNRASFYETIYDLPAAIRDLDKAIGIDPSAENYAWRARLHQQSGNDKSAIADLNSARKIDPGDTGLIYSLADLRARNGERDAALAMVEERLGDSGKVKNDFLGLKATLLGDAGKVEEGVAVLDGAIAASPGNANLLNSRCWLKGTRNVKLDTALKDCTKSIELADDPSNALDSRGLVYFRMNRMEDALADFNGALENNPDLPASLFMRGIVRAKMGDAKGSAEDLGAARAMYPQVDVDYARWGLKP